MKPASHLKPSANPLRLITEHINNSIGRALFSTVAVLPVVCDKSKA